MIKLAAHVLDQSLQIAKVVIKMEYFNQMVLVNVKVAIICKTSLLTNVIYVMLVAKNVLEINQLSA